MNRGSEICAAAAAAVYSGR